MALSTIAAKDASYSNHSDSTRSNVGTTAHGTAYMRKLESDKGASALFIDPYAEVLAGELGKKWIIDLCKTSINEAEIKNGEAAATPTEILAGLEIIDKFAVRTRVFDDFLRECILEKEFKQVCVIGAGLDTRPWRLLSTEENNSIKNLHYYEVDFEAMFAYKLPTLQEINATSSCGEYHSVAVDLSLPTWVDQLGASGFDTKKKTAWVLEGLTGYLTEEECTLMMTAITNRLSKKGSSMCASFVGLQSHSAISMHRFKTDVPLSYMSKLGWSGTQGDVIDFMKIYDRVAVVKDDNSRHGWDLRKGSQSIVKLVL